MSHALRVLVVSAAFGAVGCGGEAANPHENPAPVPSAELGSRFDPATAGEVRGRVIWKGELPVVPDVQAAIPTGTQAYRWTMMPAPYKPAIDPASQGLAGVAVYFRAVDPARSRPWDLPPVRVLLQDYQIRVFQGGPAQPVGFVRRGDEVAFASADPIPHMLRARGAAYFTLPFPEPCQPLSRRFDTAGAIELTSGAGMVWPAADLLVVEHPYHAATDAEGRFTLPKVPPGEYELVCRVRNWHVIDRDRDTETGITVRHRYAPPVEKVGRVTVAPSGAAAHDFTLSLADFPPPLP